MRLTSTIVTAVAAAALALPAGALGTSCAPPGNSGVDQYFETVPGAGCNQSSGPGGSHHGGGGSLPNGTGRQLAAQGAAGRAVQRLVAATGTNPASSTAGHPRGSTAGPRHNNRPGSNREPGSHSQLPAANGRNLFSALLHPIVSGSTSGGGGILLPLFLAAVLVLALATLVRRRRLSS